MTHTLVHLVRHGEVHNPARVLYGQLEGFRLSSRGRSQAARCARSFTGHDVTYLGASPLQRAQETAQPFATKLGLDIHTDDDLIEAGNDLQGLRVKGWDTQLINPEHWPLLVNPGQPSWGEHYTTIAARMMRAVEKARVKALGHEAILVSHQLPIVMVQRSFQDRGLAHNPVFRQCELASVTSLHFDGDRFVDMFYSEPSAII